MPDARRPPADKAREVPVPANTRARLAIIAAGLRQPPRWADTEGDTPWTRPHLDWSRCGAVTFDADNATTDKTAVAAYVDAVRRAPNDTAAAKIVANRPGRP